MVSKVGKNVKTPPKIDPALQAHLEAAGKAERDAKIAAETKAEASKAIAAEASKPQHVIDAEEASAKHAADMNDRLAEQEKDAQVMLANAADIAETLSRSDVFNGFVDHTLEAIADAEYKVVATWKHMTAILSKDQLAMLPIPDSTEEAMKKLRAEGSNEPLLFDKFKVHYKNDSGDMKTKVSSYYSELAKMLPAGKKAATISKECELASKGNINASKEYVELSKQARISKKSDADRALRNLRIAVKGAANIILMSRTIEDKLPNVGIGWVTDDDGNVVKTPKCLYLYSKKKPGETWELTIGQFLGFKITEDVVRKGTAGALKSSAADYRTAKAAEEKKKNGTGATAPVADNKWNQVSNREMLDAMAQGVGYYQKGNVMEQGERHKVFREMVMRSDLDKMTAVAMYRILKPICEANDGEIMRLADAAEQRAEEDMRKKNAPAPQQQAA